MELALSQWESALRDVGDVLRHGQTLPFHLASDELSALQQVLAQEDKDYRACRVLREELNLLPLSEEECLLLEWDPNDPEHAEFDSDPVTTTLSLIAGYEATARAWASLEADLQPDAFERLVAGVLAQQKAKRWERERNGWDRHFRRDAWKWVKLDR